MRDGAAPSRTWVRDGAAPSRTTTGFGVFSRVEADMPMRPVANRPGRALEI